MWSFVLLWRWVVVFFTMLFVVGLSLLSWITSFGLGLSHKNESFIFKLFDLFISEITNFRFRVGAVVVIFFLFFSRLILFSIFRSVLTLFTIVFTLSAVVSLITSSSSSIVSSSTVISVVSVIVVVSFSNWLVFFTGNRLSQRGWLCFNCNARGFFYFLCNGNWGRLNFRFRFRSCNDNWGLYNNGDNYYFFFNFLGRLWLNLNFFIQNITNNLFFVAHNRCNFAVSMFLNIGSECLLQFFIICKVLQSGAQWGNRLIDGWEGLVSLFNGVPQRCKFIIFWQLSSCMEYSNWACKNLEFFKLISTIVGSILNIGLFEESCNFLNASTFFNKSTFSVNFFDLFNFQIFLSF